MEMIDFIIKASLAEHPYKRTVADLGKNAGLHNLLKFCYSSVCIAHHPVAPWPGGPGGAMAPLEKICRIISMLVGNF